jgi:hypothetical protein
VEGILKKINNEFVIFKGNNYSITDKLEAVTGYKTHIHIADERQVLLETDGYVSKKNRSGKTEYYISKVNINEILNKQLNSYININIKNIQEFSEEGAAL